MSRNTLITMVLCAFAPVCAADLTIEYAGVDGERVSAVYIKGGDLRIDDFENGGSSMLFNASSKEIKIVEHGPRRYMVIDEATIVEMRQAMEQAMQMVEQMGMTREQIEQMMPGMPSKIEVTHRRTGETRTIGGQDCTVVETRINDEITHVDCVAPAADLGVGSAEIATMQALTDMLTAMTMDLLPEDMLLIDLDGAEGIPVESHDADGMLEGRLTNVSDDAVDASMFTVPNGYRRQLLEMMQ